MNLPVLACTPVENVLVPFTWSGMAICFTSALSSYGRTTGAHGTTVVKISGRNLFGKGGRVQDLRCHYHVAASLGRSKHSI
jgi:hypothetical protein